MLELVGLQGSAKKYPAQLSGGMKQRVALARALAIRPNVLLLDEPFSALDAKLRVSLRDEVRRVQQTTGVTTILVTHDQQEAFGVSDRIVVMREGSVEQVGTPRELYHTPRTPFVLNFVGHSTRAEGVVASQRAGQTRLAVGTDYITAHSRVSFAPGDAVIVAVRPESARLSHPGSEGSGVNTYAGIVSRTEFVGAKEFAEVSLPSLGISLAAEYSIGAGEERWREGDAVEVRFRPEDVITIGLTTRAEQPSIEREQSSIEGEQS